MSEGRRLRSSVPPEERENLEKKRKIEKENFENRPFIEYNGKIVYCTTFIDVAAASDELLNKVTKSPEESVILGFDLEWPFSFKRGPGKTAVMQINPTLDVTYIFHIYELKSLPKALTELLEHPKVKLTGINIINDVRKLARDFKGVNVEVIIKNLIELNRLGAMVLSQPYGRWSMEKLVSHVLKMKINKDKKVRMSKWHVMPLTSDQLKYAAIDSYASLLLCQKLTEAKQKMDETEREALTTIMID